MSMHVFFKQDKDGYKAGQSCYVEVTLARRFCRNGVAITYQAHIDEVYDAEQAALAAAAEELKAKNAKRREQAASKKPAAREKAVKK